MVQVARPARLDARMRDIASVRRGEDWRRWRQLTFDAPPFLLPEFFALAAPLTEGEQIVVTACRPDRLRCVRDDHGRHRRVGRTVLLEGVAR